MTSGAIPVLRVLVVLRSSRLYGSNVVRHTMTSQAELIYRAISKQPRIRRSMRCVTSRASFGFHRSMFISEWSLLVHVAFNTSRVRAGCQPGLFQFKAAVRIMAIAAPHRAFQNFVVKRR